MNRPYMMSRNRRDVAAIPIHPGRAPKGYCPHGRPCVPYRPSVYPTPPTPTPPPGVFPDSGGGAVSPDVMRDQTFDMNSSDWSMRETLATMVRRFGGKVVDTTPEDAR